MATKKKTKKTARKSPAKSKKPAARKPALKKKPAPKKKLVKKAKAPKKLAKKKPAVKKAAVKKSVPKKRARPTTRKADSEVFEVRQVKSKSAVQSGDLQGLSNVEDVDSESVDELIEEGNSFEAGIVSGVEDAGDADEEEVHTHEVPEDDVPEEYLDKDE
jgi:hypothetical protein